MHMGEMFPNQLWSQLWNGVEIVPKLLGGLISHDKNLGIRLDIKKKKND